MNITIESVFILLVVILLLTLIYTYYKVDIKKFYKNIDNFDSQVLETSFGNIEYFCKGEGTPVLVSHGMAGGFDQALQTGLNLVGDKSKIIAISRFGYLKSDLPKKADPESQAEAYEELLNRLKIDKVVVIAVSAGGAAGIKFALKYPERTKVLILIGSGAPTLKEIRGSTGPPHLFINDFLFWFMLKHMKFLMIPIMFGINNKVYKNAPTEEKRQVYDLLRTILPIKPRKAGMINDEKVTNLDMIKNYDTYDLDNMKVPTLIIHAKDDPLASFEDVKEMSKKIINSKFIGFDDGGHLIFGHSKEVQKLIRHYI